MHIKSTHFTSRNLLCNYGKKCRQRFASIVNLEEHALAVHQKQTNVLDNLEENNISERGVSKAASIELDISTPCKCVLFTCGQQHFTSVKKLMRHYNSAIHKSDERPCIFQGCDKIFNQGIKIEYNSYAHFYHHHRNLADRTLKSEFLLENSDIDHDNTQCIIDNPGVENSNHPEEELSCEDDYSCLDDSNVEGNDESVHKNRDDTSFIFLKSYADFLNRMAYEKMVPQSTIQIMVTEFLELSLQAMKHRRNKIGLILQENNVDEKVIEQVTGVVEEDEYISAMKQLDTPYKRDQFIELNFKYVPPREIVLNPLEFKQGKAPKDSYQYISILEGVRTLFQDKTFLEVLERSRKEVNSDIDSIEEIRDGRIIQNLTYLKKNPDAYIGLLYSDAVEITSPLAAGKGRHKILQMFWTIGDVPKKFRSKIDQIQICVIVKEHLIKKYGYSKIYEPLIEEMSLLEHGIKVQYPVARSIKVCFPFHLGDNLESHGLGGWSTCFSSRDICRQCHIQYIDLETRIHNFTAFGPHSPWSVEQYDQITNEMTSDSFTCTQAVTDDNLFTEFIR